MKQLYRFQIERELSPGIWSAIDEAFDSSVQLLQIPLDPDRREGQMVDLRRIAAEHGSEDFSAGPNFYLVASTPAQADELRRALPAQTFPVPAAVTETPPTSKPWKWIVGLIIVAAIAIAIANSTGPRPTPPTHDAENNTQEPQPPPTDPALLQLQKGQAEFNAKQYWSARKSFNASCSGGNANACGFLALLYANGLGGSLDLNKAKQLYRGSCDQGGDSHSCLSLGYLYHSGNRPDDSLALTYFNKACTAGMQDGCTQARNLSRAQHVQ